MSDTVKKVYLAGPMRGYPQFNFPAFHAAASLLRAQGYEVFSPAERDEGIYGAGFATGNTLGSEELATKTHSFNIREAMFADLEYICKEADAVFLLPGWEKSKGANAEKATAEAIGIEVRYLATNGK